MKTNLNRTITTPEEANQFIEDLFNNSELWHFDDDPEDCLEHCLESEEIEPLKKLVDTMDELPNYDPFDFACELLASENQN